MIAYRKECYSLLSDRYITHVANTLCALHCGTFGGQIALLFLLISTLFEICLCYQLRMLPFANIYDPPQKQYCIYLKAYMQSDYLKY